MIGLLRPRLNSISLERRLAALPRDGLPLQRSAVVHWNDHQVPFIEADSDRDLAVCLGLVHVHLRWAQMELMRRVAQGRLSELIGPFGIKLDRVLRSWDFPRAVPQIAASLPAETRSWLEGFLAGINHAVRHLPAAPPEFRLLGMRREPWELTDLLSLVRLAAADVTWAVWLALLPERQQAGVPELWQRLLGTEVPLDASADHLAAGAVGRLRRALMRFARAGSNSWAVAPSHTASGTAWIASDTHLPSLLPNLWLLAGYRSPSYHLTGLMVPGIPAALIGRNPWIAWGGTNLHATSSDLFDVAGLPAGSIIERRERLRVRFRGEREVVIRETPFGPIISDLPQLRPGGGSYALRWMGHRPSDEVSALLGMNRARDWQEFRAALDGIGVPGQNITYADRHGHIGQAMAAHLPARPPQAPASLVLPRSEADHWHRILRGGDLPAELDPPTGFVASANNRPPPAPVLIGHFFSANHRIGRLRAALSAETGWDFARFSALQQDVLLLAAEPMRQRLATLLRNHGTRAAAQLAQRLDGWNGSYGADAAGPLVMELLLYHLGMAVHGPRMMRLLSSGWNARGTAFAELDRLPPAAQARALDQAVPRVARDLRRFRNWGRIHRLEPRHVLGSVPLLGRAWRFGDWPAGGGSDTLMKTAHAMTNRRHRAGLASTARHISNLGDIDANWFVLLGGQDGWIGSTTMLDQTRLWRNGGYIKIPLQPAAVRAAFPHRTELRP